MPAVANLLGAGEPERIRRGFWRAMRLLALTTPALVAGVAVTGPALLRLVYGERYSGAGTVLLVAARAAAPAADAHAVQRASSTGSAARASSSSPGSSPSVVDLGLALALIPRFDAVGAALANGAAQLVAGVPCLVLVDPPAPPRRHVGRAGGARSGARARRRRGGVGGARAARRAPRGARRRRGLRRGRPRAAPASRPRMGNGSPGRSGTAACSALRTARHQNHADMIDLHAHLLPGLDDGAPDEDAAVALAAEAVARGVRTMAATPHLRADFPRVKVGELAARAERLRERLARAGVALEVVQAGEVDVLGRRPRATRQLRAGQLRRPRARPARRDALRRAARDVRGPAVQDPRARLPHPARAPGAQPVLPARRRPAARARRRAASSSS